MNQQRTAERELKHEVFELMLERLEKADRASRRVWLALLIGLIPMAGLELLKVRLYKRGEKP